MSKVSEIGGILLNAILYQGAWLACVYGAARGYPHWGVWSAGAILGAHLYFTGNRASTVALCLLFAIFGLLVDSGLMWLGVHQQFSSPGPFPLLAPVWLVAIWAVFAITMHHSLRWLGGRYLLAAMVGGICGPLVYRAGAAIGAIVPHPSLVYSLSMLAVTWALALPLMVYAAHHPALLNGLPGAELKGTSAHDVGNIDSIRGIQR